MASSNRRQPQRSARTSTTRPSNYYARPFGYRSSLAAQPENEPHQQQSIGFFPGIQHFTDAIVALPKEVMRHFTLIKETEGKAYQPDLAIGELASAILKLPQPPHRQLQHTDSALLGLSLLNSATASVNGSVTEGSVTGPPAAPSDAVSQSGMVEESVEKRHALFMELQSKLREIIMVLDEKNMVLASANETLTRQLARIDNILPAVESEVSEEARLGSNTHWALPHMKDLRRNNTSGSNERPRRDVQAANNLAAAAAAVHEGDIAATRSEARREAVAARRGRQQNVDSDFDDRAVPKRANPAAKGNKRALEGTTAGDARMVSGTAQPVKRRRVDKGASTEKAMSAALNGKLATSKDNAGIKEGAAVRKKPRPLAAGASRKKNLANSPSIGSSPTRGTFATTARKESSPAPNAQRGGASSARARGNSVQSISHDAARSKTASAQATSKGINGATTSSIQVESRNLPGTQLPSGTTGTPTGQSVTDSHVQPAPTPSNTLKREETEPMDTNDPNTPLTATQQVRRARDASKTSKPATPDDEQRPASSSAAIAAPMSRSRSNRGAQQAAPTAASASPATAAASPRRSHKKGAGSVSALKEATARDSSSTSSAEDAKNAAAAAATGVAGESGSGTQRPSRRAATKASANEDAASDIDAVRSKRAPGNTAVTSSTQSTATLAGNIARPRSSSPSSLAPTPIPLPNLTLVGGANATDTSARRTKALTATTTSNLSEPDEELEEELEDDEEEEHDPDEPRYCVCGDFSYGDMIACDNDECPREWFHLQCVGLSKAPSSKTKWYCEECRAKMRRVGNGR